MKELAVLCCHHTLMCSPRGNPFFPCELSPGQVRVRQMPCFHLKPGVPFGPTYNLRSERSALLKARSHHPGWAPTTHHPNQKHSLKTNLWVQVGYGWDIPTNGWEYRTNSTCEFSFFCLENPNHIIPFTDLISISDPPVKPVLSFVYWEFWLYKIIS